MFIAYSGDAKRLLDYDYEKWDEETTKTTTSLYTRYPQLNYGGSDFQRYVNEIHQEQKQLMSGLFIASLVVFLETCSEVPLKYSVPLLEALHQEVLRLNKEKQLHKLGSLVPNYADYMTGFFIHSTLPRNADDIAYIIRKRKIMISEDLRDVLDFADHIFQEEDVKNTAEVLIDLEHYPRTALTSSQIAKKALEALVLTPHKRIQGTEIDKLLKVAIKNVLQSLNILEGEKK